MSTDVILRAFLLPSAPLLRSAATSQLPVTAPKRGCAISAGSDHSVIPLDAATAVGFALFGCSSILKVLRRRHRLRRRERRARWQTRCSATSDWREFRKRLAAAEQSSSGADEGEGQGLDEGRIWQPARRKFRARPAASVQSSSGAVEGEAKDQKIYAVDAEGDAAWAGWTSLVEQGSVLLASPGDHFALENQQYIKAVVLIISHSDEEGDVGIVLNRPSRLTTEDFGFEEPHWKVWFGGGDVSDLQVELKGVSPKLRCLHGLERLAMSSREVIDGLFIVDFDEARKAVEAGVAERGDFVTFVGCSNWKPGELQQLADSRLASIYSSANSVLTRAYINSTAWTLATTSKEALFECLRVYEDLAVFEENRGELDDGISKWRNLYDMLGPEFKEAVDNGYEADESQIDDLLRRWIGRSLIAPIGYDADDSGRRAIALRMGDSPTFASIDGLRPGRILYASPQLWILGKPWGPAAVEAWDFNLAGMPPSQYLNRAVLLLLEGEVGKDVPSKLVLLNGPRLKDDSSEVYYGGPDIDESAFREFGSRIRRIGDVNTVGCTVLEDGLLEALVQAGALQVADAHITAEALLDNATEYRWELAGGKLDSISDIRAAALADVQRERWFKKFCEFPCV